MAYNPNQPRVPAGNDDGGQWTSGGGGSGRNVNPILKYRGVVDDKGQLTPQTRKRWKAKLDAYKKRGMLSPGDFAHMNRLRKILGEE